MQVLFRCCGPPPATHPQPLPVRHPLLAGKSLFTYAFFDRQRPQAQAFFADIYSEAVAAEPAAGHHALRQLHDAGRLLRHYTLNIDGLAEQVGAGKFGAGLTRVCCGVVSRAGGAVLLPRSVFTCASLCCAVLEQCVQPLLVDLHARTLTHRWAWTRGTTSATPAA